MDAEDIFKKLSAGAIFKKRKVPQLCNKIKIEKKTSTLDSNKTSADVENCTSVEVEKNPRFNGKNPAKAKLLEIEETNFKRNKYNINVSGENVPPPLEHFDEMSKVFGISNQLIQNVKNGGYESPTPIQMQAIPIMLKRKQILACAPTGSGKTAAFLIPIIHHLQKPKNIGFRAIIVSPTRELSRQTYRECVRLNEGINLRIHITTQIKEIVKKTTADSTNKYDILITTPNRLVYLLNQESSPISLKNVEWLVVDESDKLFEAGVRGFRDQLACIYQACDSKNVKRAMFSATYTAEVAKWCRKNLQNLVSVTVGHRNTTVENVEQQLIYVGNEEGKLIAMRDLILQGMSPPVLIFLQSKERARELFYELLYDGINVDVIHADRTQLQRDNVVKAFREGKIWVLICTELMGRGIDFKGVNLVINYDFPPSAISYIHRIGRTGRAGRGGKAITFFTDDDTPYLKSVVNVMRESGCEVPEFLIALKKPHKKILKKLKKHPIARPSVIEKPHRYKPLLKKQKEKTDKNGKTQNEKSGKNDKLKLKKMKKQKIEKSLKSKKVKSDMYVSNNGKRKRVSVDNELPKKKMRKNKNLSK